MASTTFGPNNAGFQAHTINGSVHTTFNAPPGELRDERDTRSNATLPWQPMHVVTLCTRNPKIRLIKMRL